MSLNKHYISCAVLGIGLLIYCCYVSAFEFIPASITMLTALLFWIAITMHFEIFNKITFAKVFCCAGLLLSLSIFFLFGIEEVPFPNGALLFHGYGIALSLLVILLSITPILFIMDFDLSSLPTNSQFSEAISPPTETANETEDLNDDWEIATENDLESGDYEVAA